MGRNGPHYDRSKRLVLNIDLSDTSNSLEATEPLEFANLPLNIKIDHPIHPYHIISLSPTNADLRSQTPCNLRERISRKHARPNTLPSTPIMPLQHRRPKLPMHSTVPCAVPTASMRAPRSIPTDVANQILQAKEESNKSRSRQ